MSKRMVEFEVWRTLEDSLPLRLHGLSNPENMDKWLNNPTMVHAKCCRLWLTRNFPDGREPWEMLYENDLRENKDIIGCTMMKDVREKGD